MEGIGLKAGAEAKRDARSAPDFAISFRFVPFLFAKLKAHAEDQRACARLSVSGDRGLMISICSVAPGEALGHYRVRNGRPAKTTPFQT